MARPHHRKKHKQRLQQYKHSLETTSGKQKRRASILFAGLGAIAGLLIFSFAFDEALVWLIIGFIIGGTIGYLIGRSFDKQIEK